MVFFSSHYKHPVSTKDANNNIHQRSQHHSSKQINGVSSSSHQKFNLK